MNHALLFHNGEQIVVSAQDVKNGKYARESEFVDVEHPDYKVEFVSGGKPKRNETIGIPYFRLYYSYEDYKRLFPDRADKYKIICDMRHYQESQWHKDWKAKVSSFCTTEKYFKHEDQWKYADAFYDKFDTCIEFQHSYTSSDFEKRNKFYTALHKNMIWLFHMPKANVRKTDDGYYEILENNAKGFFRAAYETQDKFNDVNVFIQVKSNKIYKVKELFQRESDLNGLVATVRYFVPSGTWTENEWINDLKNGAFSKKSVFAIEDWDASFKRYRLSELWKNNYELMIVIGTIKNQREWIRVFRDEKAGNPKRNDEGCIIYEYAGDDKKREYPLSHQDEQAQTWMLIQAYTINRETVTLNPVDNPEWWKKARSLN